jgi:ribosome-associated protein
MNKPNFLKFAKRAAELADEKKCLDIKIININKISSIAEYFVIASVESQPQMNAVVMSVKKTFNNDFAVEPLHYDKSECGSWSCIDYGGVVIHVMTIQARSFYNLENIWSEGRQIAYGKS